MESDKLAQIIEALLFAASQPLSARKIVALFAEHERPEISQVNEMLTQLQSDYSERGIHLQTLASGWQFRVDNALAPWIKQLWKTPTPRYSRALMETLALIAYRQPITRGEIEHIRGISVSSNIVRTLEEHGWIREVGHKDTPGRPALLATTKQFLDHFGLKSLGELPPLAEINSLDSIGANLEQALQTQQIDESRPEETTPATTETNSEEASDIESATVAADSNHHTEAPQPVQEEIEDITTESEEETFLQEATEQEE
ncbi:MAG: SMC-Scp complex subunit ScpB [Gammaproteobacteria bacterium]|nr:SMC-Scp complex subunit ScpB [Gammaproteobacteria bacterium]